MFQVLIQKSLSCIYALHIRPAYTTFSTSLCNRWAPKSLHPILGSENPTHIQVLQSGWRGRWVLPISDTRNKVPSSELRGHKDITALLSLSPPIKYPSTPTTLPKLNHQDWLDLFLTQNTYAVGCGRAIVLGNFQFLAVLQILILLG